MAIFDVMFMKFCLSFDLNNSHLWVKQIFFTITEFCGVVVMIILLYVTFVQVYNLIGDGSLENPLYVNNVQQCYGGNRAQNLTRSHLFTCPDDNSRLLLVAGDEASSSVSLFRLLFWEKLPDLSDEVQTRMVVIDFQALISFSFIDIYFHCDKSVSFLISTVRLHTHCFDIRFSLFIQWSTIWLTICAKLIICIYLQIYTQLLFHYGFGCQQCCKQFCSWL